MFLDNEFYPLDKWQVGQLHQILNDVHYVDGGLTLPTLKIRPKDICREISIRLKATDIIHHDVRLYGSAASAVLLGSVAGGRSKDFSDVDIFFTVDFDMVQASKHFHTLLTVTMEALKALFPVDLRQHAQDIPNGVLSAMYVSKLVKVPNQNNYSPTDDVWSLITLRNDSGKCIEIKFIKQMKRQCEFSMDSFQIVLNETLLSPDSETCASEIPVEACSMHGQYLDALESLRKEIISIHKPEQVRGGGLLKYCRLLVRGYRHPENMTRQQRAKLESLMCTRFFIDFPTVESQFNTLLACLQTHHFSDRINVLRFLDYLYDAIANYSREEMDWGGTLDMLHFVHRDVEHAPEVTLPHSTLGSDVAHNSNARHIPLHAGRHTRRGRPQWYITVANATPTTTTSGSEDEQRTGHRPVNKSAKGAVSGASARDVATGQNIDAEYPSPPATPDMKPQKTNGSRVASPQQSATAANTTCLSHTLACNVPLTSKSDGISVDISDGAALKVQNSLLTPTSSEHGSTVSDESSSDGEDVAGGNKMTETQPQTLGPMAATLQQKEEVFTRCRKVIAVQDNADALLAKLDANIVHVDDRGFFGNRKSSGQTILMVAAKHGRVQCVIALADRLGATINQAGGMGMYTALHYAAYHGHGSVVRALVERRADCSLVTEQKETPEMAARVNGFHDVAEYLRACQHGLPRPTLPDKAVNGNGTHASPRKSNWKENKKSAPATQACHRSQGAAREMIAMDKHCARDKTRCSANTEHPRRPHGQREIGIMRHARDQWPRQLRSIADCAIDTQG